MPRPLFALLFLIVLLVAPGRVALADCAGENLFAALAGDDPAAREAILERAARVHHGEGLLWRVEAPGARASHLFGTVHSTEAAARGLPPAAEAALVHARRVVLEVSPEEEERLRTRMREDPGLMMLEEPRPITERYEGSALATARRALASRGLPTIVAGRMKPWALLAAFSVPACEQQAMAAGAPILDRLVAERARAAGVPVTGLETIEDVISAFGSLGPEELDRLLLEAFAAVPHEEDLKATLEALYEAERIAAIMQFNIWFSEELGTLPDSRASAAALERALLSRRNREWLPALAAEMRQGGAFAAVGALHLPGEDGLVSMLEREGFGVTRVPLAR